MDVMKLMMSDFEVSLGESSSPNDFYVKLLGPKGSPYEGGIWKVHVTLPANYPYSSPSIGFTNHIYHPNVDFASGSVCLDVINQTWSPMYNLVNVFSTFLPQLLLYPNPADPLNGEAASLMNKDLAAYTKKVQELVKMYASAQIKVKMEDDDAPAPKAGAAPAAASASAAAAGARAAGAAAAAASGSAPAAAAASSAPSKPAAAVASVKDSKQAEEDDLVDDDADAEQLSDLDDEPAGAMDL